MEQEYSNALKIHKANKDLHSKNTIMKQLMEKQQTDHKTALEAKE
jgi:hypothetical protein